MTSEPLLSVRNLTKSITLHLLGEKRVSALSDVTFDVARGEFIAVVGLSGSGKSSLLKCIYRTYLSSSGQIEYVDRHGRLIDLASVNEQDVLNLRKSEIRYVSQFLKAPPRVVAVDVVARPLQDAGRDATTARCEASRILGALGISRELSSSYPSLFSGGEQQRVNVARAVAAPSRLMLLDEPTSALDAENRRRVLTQLSRVKESGSTVVGVFHDRDVLRELADRVIVMEQGRVVQQGSRNDVDITRYVGTETTPVI